MLESGQEWGAGDGGKGNPRVQGNSIIAACVRVCVCVCVFFLRPVNLKERQERNPNLSPVQSLKMVGLVLEQMSTIRLPERS